MRARVLSAALPLALSLVPALAAPETAAERRARTLEIARTVMVAARYCAFTSIGADGGPEARIVDPLEPDATFAVYVATNPLSRKVAQIGRDPRVTLLYFDRARSAYVTLVGRAAEVVGAEKTRRRKPEWQQFFPAEKPDTYLLYRITPLRLEVVSAADGLAGDPVTWKPEIIEFKDSFGTL